MLKHMTGLVRTIITLELAVKLRRYSKRKVPAQLKSDIKNLTKYVFVAGTDKAANTPFFVCKHLIRALAVERLSSPDFKFSNAPMEQLLDEAIRTMKKSFPRVRSDSNNFLYLVAIFKLHKMTFRWLTNAVDSFLTPLSQVVDATLATLKEEVMKHCGAAIKTAKAFHGVETTRWWVIDSVQDYSCNLPNEIYSMFSADISKCFENISIDDSPDDLINAIQFFVKIGFSHIRSVSGCTSLRVSYKRNGEVRCSMIRSGSSSTASSFLVDADGIIEMCKWILKRCYTMFGNSVWRLSLIHI